MKNSISFLLILVLFSTALSAQKKGWVQGYVVTIQGDTFRGTIKYGNNILSDARYDACHIIKFRNARGIKINFTPPFTKSYKRGDDFFLSYKVYSGNEAKSKFIKRIKQGDMDMYLYYGERKSFMYLLKKPGAGFVMFESDNTDFTFKRTYIKAEMMKYFKECEAVTKKIEDGTYRIYNLRMKDFPAMVDEYNKCSQ